MIRKNPIGEASKRSFGKALVRLTSDYTLSPYKASKGSIRLLRAL